MSDHHYPDLMFDMNEKEARRLVEFAVSLEIAPKFLGRPFDDQLLLRMESAIHDVLSRMRRMDMLAWLPQKVAIKPRRLSLNDCNFEWSDGFLTD